MRAVSVPFFISHQGCPYNCIYCDQRIISGSQGSLPQENEILQKVATWRQSSPGRPLEVAFFGGSFTALPDQVQESLLAPLQTLLADGIVRGIRISTRPDYIDADRLKWLARHGVDVIEFGVQSMDDDVLHASGRGYSPSVSTAAIKLARKYGLEAGAQLMPGLPADTIDKSLLSLKSVIASGASFIRLYPAVVIRGTELANLYVSGRYRPLDLQRGITICKVLLHAAMMAEVPVIRIGLQAEEGLNRDTVLAGCFHPALGQLVRSALYFDLAEQLLSHLPVDSSGTISCHPTRVSDVVGHGRSNLIHWRNQGLLVDVMADPTLRKDELTIRSLDQYFKKNIVTCLKYNINEV